MTRLAVNKTPKEFAEALDRVASKGERIVLERDGKNVAALVSVEDLALLEQLQDRIDDADAEAAVAEAAAKGEDPVPWARVKAELGLK